MKKLLPLYILFILSTLSAQNNTWEYYAPAPEVSCLSANNNSILAGTYGGGIVHFDTLLNRQYYNTGNSGLPSDSLFQIAIDAGGHWWVQHRQGISKFDGATWQTWSIAQTGLTSGAAIRALKGSPDSSMFVATDQGVAIFKAGAWTVLNTANSGLPTNNVWGVAFGSGDGKRYFATTGSGIVVQDGSNWTSYTSANTGVSNLNNVYSVAVTTENVLWAIGGLNLTALIRLAKFEAGSWTGYTAAGIGIATPAPPLRKLAAGNAGRLILTTSSTVSILEQGAWTHHPVKEQGCSTSIGIFLAAPSEDGAGRIWVHYRCGLTRFDGQAWKEQVIGLPGTPDGYMYEGITEGSDGSMWLGAEFGRYIARLKPDETWEQHFPVDHGAVSNDVYSLQAGPDGSIWFGLDSARILRHLNGNWTLFDTCATHFPGHIVQTSAVGPNGDRWFSFINPSSPPAVSLARYSAIGQWQFFTQANTPLPPAYIGKILIEANGTAWFSTGNTVKGIFRYNGVTWDSITVSNSGLPSNRVYSMAKAPDGAIWATTDAGLARYDGQNWTVFTSTNSGLPSSRVTRVAFDKAGSMYVGYAPETPGTPGARVAELRGGVWTELIPPNWTNSLSDDPDAFFVDSKNRLWFAKAVDNDGGLHRYDPMLVNLEEPSFYGTVTVSPNPCNERCLVTLADVPISGDLQLFIHNSTGQLVQHLPDIPGAQPTTVIDMSNKAPGLYWISIRVDNKIIGRAKLLKQ